MVQSFLLAGSLSLQLTTSSGSPGDASRGLQLAPQREATPAAALQPAGPDLREDRLAIEHRRRTEPVRIGVERLRALDGCRAGEQEPLRIPDPRHDVARRRDDRLGREDLRRHRASTSATGRASIRVTWSATHCGAGHGVHPPQHMAVAPRQQAVRQAETEDDRRERVDGQPDPLAMEPARAAVPATSTMPYIAIDPTATAVGR